MKTTATFAVCLLFIIGSTVKAQIPATPEICMVTVDEESINNIIYWDKTSYTNVDSFIVYREVSTLVYKQVGAVLYDSLSMFVDTVRSIGPNTGDPNTNASRYKLKIRNTSGNYSAYSPYHSTIYITDAGPGSGDFTIQVPYTIEGGLNPVTNYNLICDTTTGSDTWFNVTTIAGSASLASDMNVSSQPDIAEWRMQTDWSIACTPTRAINTSRSNIKHPGIITGILPIATFDGAVTIYPNPVKDNFIIELSALTKNAQLKIVNVLGQMVYNETVIASSGKTMKQINTGNFAKGVYKVVVETNTSKLIKKLVIN